MENLTNANEMFFICKRLLKCEKIVSIDTVLTRWHLKTWCNLFCFHVKKPTSVYRRDKYTCTAVKKYTCICVCMKNWDIEKKEKKVPLLIWLLVKKLPPFLTQSSTCRQFYDVATKPLPGQGRGRRDRGEGGGGRCTAGRLTPFELITWRGDGDLGSGKHKEV